MDFTFENPRIQYFSFPPDVIFRLWKHPRSSAGALKLYQTCKYFYYKQNAAFFDEILYHTGYQKEFGLPKFNLKENVLLFSLRNALEIVTTLPPFLDTNAKMLRYSNITILSLRYLNLKYNEFEILTSITPLKSFTLRDSKICYSDDSPVTIDTVLARLPNIDSFCYGNQKDNYPLKALKNLNKLKLSNKLKSFQLSMFCELDNTFDPTLLCQFIKNNVRSRGEIHVGAFFWDATKGKALMHEIRKIPVEWKGKKGMWPSVGYCGPHC